MPAVGAQWNEADVYLESLMEDRAAIRYESVKDTIIDSSLYSAIYHTWSASFYQFGLCQFHFTSDPKESNNYIGAVKSNERKQVFFIPAEDSISYLIYDFSLSIGDTIDWPRPDYPERFSGFVTEIDSIQIEGKYRKRISLTIFNALPDQWIEGIGSIFGFLSTFGYRSWEKVIHELMCYRDSEIPQVFFHGYGCSMCDIVTLTSNISNAELKLYPNPVSDFLRVELPASFLPSQMRIYDFSAKLVFATSQMNGIPVIVDCQDLVQGVYILEIKDRHRNVLREIILKVDGP